MRNAPSMGKMQGPAQNASGTLMPQFRDLRHVPSCYQHILSLEVMKRYHCAVIGSAQGVLTIAISDRQGPTLVEVLTKLTGQAIFPVWVRPTRMRLLIQRMERWQQHKTKMLRWPHSLSLVQLHTIVTVPIYRMEEVKK